MLVIVNFKAANRATRRITAINLGILLVATAAVGDAIAAVDCNPTPVHHHASAKHRSHHRRAKVHPRPSKPKAAGAKRTTGLECHPVAVTLADIGALGTPEDVGLMAPADLAPGLGPDSPESDAPPDIQLVSFPTPPFGVGGGGGGPGGGSPGSGGPAGGGPGGGGPGGGGPGGGGPGGGGPGGGGPGGGGPGGGGPGGGTYTPLPGGGGPPSGGGGFPGGSVPGVPEPATWTMMLIGVGAAGAIVRLRRGAARVDA